MCGKLLTVSCCSLTISGRGNGSTKITFKLNRLQQKTSRFNLKSILISVNESDKSHGCTVALIRLISRNIRISWIIKELIQNCHSNVEMATNNNDTLINIINARTIFSSVLRLCRYRQPSAERIQRPPNEYRRWLFDCNQRKLMMKLDL